MIVRSWRGWTGRDNADRYARFLAEEFLPAAEAIPGLRGAQILRRDDGDEVAFLILTHFETVDAIRAFAGADWEAAHIAPQALQWLTRYDSRCVHYEQVHERRR
jgi:heme-degrading monooxygenase HmoA